MSNIIDELYLGDINPNENMQIDNPCYSKLSKQAYSLSEQLESKLNPEEKKLFEAFINADCSMLALEVRLRFIEGFRLGAKIMLDVLASPNPDVGFDLDFLEELRQ